VLLEELAGVVAEAGVEGVELTGGGGVDAQLIDAGVGGRGGKGRGAEARGDGE